MKRKLYLGLWACDGARDGSKMDLSVLFREKKTWQGLMQEIQIHQIFFFHVQKSLFMKKYWYPPLARWMDRKTSPEKEKHSLVWKVQYIFSWNLAMIAVMCLNGHTYYLNTTISIGGCSLFQLSLSRRQGTPWTGCQFITGPHRDKQPSRLTHTLQGSI